MMKRLLLLRHAKSSWKEAGLDDHERPLNGRGRKAASRMGRYLAAEKLLPDLVLCSSAKRTVETLERLEEDWEGRIERRIERRLYLASAEQILGLVHGLEPDWKRVLVVAHNPSLHQLALRLVGEGSEEERASLRLKYPTGALAEIAFSVDRWQELTDGGGRLLRFVRPRDL